jgi:tetratricopeptide (TPR) repeat protein
MTRKSRKSSRRPRRTGEGSRAPGDSGTAGTAADAPEARKGIRGLTDRPWFWPAVIFAVAFLLRAVYTFQVRYTPFFQTLGLDAKFYDQWARDIAGGTAERGAFFMTPLYSYFLAIVYRLFGRDLLLVRMIQAGLGAATASLVYLLGRDVFDRRVGLLAGLLTASYGALIFYDCSVLLTPLLVFLNVLAVYLLLRADASGKPIHYLAAGAVLGLATIGRAAALLPAAAAVLWIGLSGRAGAVRTTSGTSRSPGGLAPPRGGGPSATRSVALCSAALVVLGIALVVGPVTLRNYVVERDFVLITSNGGLNFFIGNGEGATGGYVKPEELDIVTDPDGRAIAERALGRELKPSEVSGYWYDRGWTQIKARPGQWAKLMVRKLAFVMSSYELPQLENYYFQKRYSALLALPLPGFAIIAPLGLVGLALTFRRRRPRLLALYSSVYLLSIVGFFVVARYRLPVVPALIVLASYAVMEIARRARAREFAALAVPLVVLGVLLYVVNANHYDVDRESGFAQPHFRLGIIYGERGMTEEAVAEYETAIRLDPDYPKSYLNLGAVLSGTGRTDEAMAAFREALRLNPGYASARINLAMLLERSGDYDRALAHVDTVLGWDRRNATALKERGVILYKAGSPDEAEEWLREALKWDTAGEERAEIEFYLGLLAGSASREIPPDVITAFARADTLAKAGRVVEAFDILEEAAQLAPYSGEPLRRQALLKRDMGLLDEALELMAEALRLDPALEKGHYMYGVFLNEAGRHDEALLEYDAELRIHPDFAPAHLNLALTHYFYAGNPNLGAFHYRRHLVLGGARVAALEALLRDLESPNGP